MKEATNTLQIHFSIYHLTKGLTRRVTVFAKWMDLNYCSSSPTLKMDSNFGLCELMLTFFMAIVPIFLAEEIILSFRISLLSTPSTQSQVQRQHVN